MAKQRKAVDEAAVCAAAEVFSRIESPEEMRRFFDEILTASEVRALALRWLLLQRLNVGIPQRKIAQELRISLCKITRGSKILKDRNSVTVRLLREASQACDSETDKKAEKYERSGDAGNTGTDGGCLVDQTHVRGGD